MRANGRDGKEAGDGGTQLLQQTGNSGGGGGGCKGGGLEGMGYGRGMGCGGTNVTLTTTLNTAVTPTTVTNALPLLECSSMEYGNQAGAGVGEERVWQQQQNVNGDLRGYDVHDEDYNDESQQML